jgi:hypothetical protein
LRARPNFPSGKTNAHGTGQRRPEFPVPVASVPCWRQGRGRSGNSWNQTPRAGRRRTAAAAAPPWRRTLRGRAGCGAAAARGGSHRRWTGRPRCGGARGSGPWTTGRRWRPSPLRGEGGCEASGGLGSARLTGSPLAKRVVVFVEKDRNSGVRPPLTDRWSDELVWLCDFN